MPSFCAGVHLSQGDKTTKGRQAPFKTKINQEIHEFIFRQ